MKRIAGILFVAAACVAAPQPAAAAGQLFLKLPGVVGPSQAQGHEGEIPVLSFSIGASSPSKRVPGEVCSDLAVMKVLDQTSPILFQRTIFGIDFKTATLTFADTVAGAFVNVYSLTLQNVSITSVQESGANEQPAESVSLHGTSWTATYWPIQDDGKQGPPVTTTVRCE